MGKRQLKNRLKDRKYKRVEDQINSLHEDVDKSIAYFSLGYGILGENVKVITADEELSNVLYAKINELNINSVAVKLVYPEKISLHLLQTFNNLVSDP